MPSPNADLTLVGTHGRKYLTPEDAATRGQILAALKSKLRSDGPKSVVANKGYKRYLEAEKGAFAVDLDKAHDEERFDGMWVLRTNTELSAVEIALRYWMPSLCHLESSHRPRPAPSHLTPSSASLARLSVKQDEQSPMRVRHHARIFRQPSHDRRYARPDVRRSVESVDRCPWQRSSRRSSSSTFSSTTVST